MTADRPNTKDGQWHASRTFSPRPIPVHTMVGTQHHRGSHALVFRWTGTKWEYNRCGCIHKKRSTTLACAVKFASRLNRDITTHPSRSTP